MTLNLNLDDVLIVNTEAGQYLRVSFDKSGLTKIENYSENKEAAQTIYANFEGGFQSKESEG